MKAATHSGAFYHVVCCFLQHIRLTWRFKLRNTALVFFFLCIISSPFLIFASSVFAATGTLEPASGYLGTIITVKCTGLTRNTPGNVWFDIDLDGVLDAGEPSVSVTTTSLGTLPAGTTLIAPSVVAGVYPVCIDAPSGNPIEASPNFTMLPATISANPSSGPTGTIIIISGGGFAASTAGNVWFDSNGNGGQDTDEPSSSVTTTATGAIPSGVLVTAPAVVEGIYQVLADIPTGNPVETSAIFTITPPAISLNPDSGVSGTVITVTGGGFAASATGNVWFDTDDDSFMDGDEPQAPVTSTDTGAIPAGITLTAPMLNPVATYRVRADIPSGDPVEASADFNTPATTTWLTVTKYDAYGNVLATESVTYQWLEDNLPIQGNGTRRYYHQGPSFDNSTLQKLWDPDETFNVETRDYGLPMGTDVKDICALVGEANPGDTIQIKASDNFNKWFDYEDVYNPDLAQGKMVICWWLDGQYVPDWQDGMRLVFFAETTNPYGFYVFGNWDQHECFPENRWYYYSGEYPTTTGHSVKYIDEINIYSNQTTECDLIISVSGSGTTSPSAGVHSYAPDTVVDITATPASGWQFIEWTGDVANPDSATTTVTLDDDKTITAIFERITQDYDLTIEISGSGTTTPSAGVHSYTRGTVVSITATPADGWQFAGWTGNVANHNSATTTVTMNRDRTVTAIFTQISRNCDLTIEISGSGTTTPSLGKHSFTQATIVNIAATPASGWQFAGWTGSVADPSSADTTVTINDDMTIVANFAQSSANDDLTIVVSGSGTTTPPAGIYSYSQGVIVGITAVPDGGWQFVSWTGNVADPNSATTNVTMNGDITIVANFVQSMVNYNLIIAVSGNGTTIPPAGIYSYTQGDIIGIAAVPDDGWKFVKWTGSVANPNSATTTVVMDADKIIMAEFTQEITGKIASFESPDDTLKSTKTPQEIPWYIILGIAGGIVAVVVLMVAIIRDLRRK